MSIPPTYGIYVSENQSFSIEITEATSSVGEIVAKYTAKYSPEGELKDEGKIGRYHWVHSQALNRQGVAPFCIRFAANIRPQGYPYCIEDTWTGAYMTDDTMFLQGVRCYVNGKGEVKVMSLGTSTFKLTS